MHGSQCTLRLRLLVFLISSIGTLISASPAEAQTPNCPAAIPNDGNPDTAAINACLSGGGTVVLQDGGLYLINDPTPLGSPVSALILDVDNTTLRGQGGTNWPILRALTQSATLRHGYSATYDAGFRSNPLAGSIVEKTLRLTDESGASQSIRLFSEAPFLEAQTVRVSERFQPLVGVNLSFKGGFQTDINWNTSQNNTLAAANASVSQTQTQELSLRLSFNKTGVRLPLPFLSSRRLNNNLRFSLIVSQANNLSRRFALVEDLQQDIAENRTLTFLDPEGERTTRLSIEPQLSYTLSNQVTVAAFVRYQKFDSEGSRNPSTTTINGGFNFRVSFSN